MNAHVLLVEDDDSARMIMSYILKKDGYRVTAAADGESALQLLETCSFDVVITDIHVGYVDGIQVLKAAKACDSHVNVIVISGVATQEMINQSLSAGAYDYLPKPCDPVVLLDRVKKALKPYSFEIGRYSFLAMAVS